MKGEKNDNPKGEGLKQLKTLDRKWGRAVIGLGWTAIPNLLLERQRALGLDAVDLNILLVLMKHWWAQDNLPFPSKRKIADTIGRDVSTVQRHIREMEDRKLVMRNIRKFDSGGQTSNEYDLTGLIGKLKEYAKEEVQTRKQRKEQDGRKLRGFVKNPSESVGG